jgi:hypothetical protein
MSGSRSLAAARNRRAGDAPPKLQAGRSMNTISQQPMQYQQPPVQQQQQKPNGLPFSKLSISDAIGLITLRLGKVEQFLIDQQNNPTSSNNTDISPGVDNTLLTSLTRRLDEMEKKEKPSNITELKTEISTLNVTINELHKQLDEIKTETFNKFQDYETAIIDLENRVLPEGNDVPVSSLEEIVDEPAESNEILVVSDNTNETIVETVEDMDTSKDKKKGRKKKMNVPI